jgi:hypothetical protein
MIDPSPAIALEPSLQCDFFVYCGLKSSFDNDTLDRSASVFGLCDLGQELFSECAVAGLQSFIAVTSDLEPFELHSEVGGARRAKYALNAQNES